MSDHTVTLNPHHPRCRHGAHDGWWAKMDLDPDVCCYCAALARDEREPLDFRYGGPRCACKPTESEAQ